MGDVVARSNKRKTDQKKALAAKDFVDDLLPDAEIAKLTKDDDEQVAKPDTRVKRENLDEGGEGTICEECGGVHESNCPGDLDEGDDKEEKAKERIKKKAPWLKKAGEFADKASADDSKKNENWTSGNKDQLLFERLVEKWTK